MWDESIVAINKHLADEIKRPNPVLPGSTPLEELWYGHADMNTGKRTATTYGALDAFFPAVLVLSGDHNRARDLQKSSFSMWRKHEIEPERFDYVKNEVVSAGYPLRPEIIESTYYLFQYWDNDRIRLTNDRRRRKPDVEAELSRVAAESYLIMGEQMWKDFVTHCRTDEAYAALKSVVTKEKNDSMQSFLFAETFKYFYLLFEPRTTLDFDKVIFNTEAHPVRRK